jgi:hypothetical protein
MARSPQEIISANRHAARTVQAVAGLMQWVVVHPLVPRTYEQADDMLKRPRCIGIKIHPELHRYPIRRFGRAFFEFAEKHGAIVLTHSGEKRSLPSDFIEFANDHPGIRLILAHLGFGYDQDVTHQVRAIQNSRHGNVFADTSSSKSIVPGLIEWAVREVGADRIVFGTDTPLYFAPMQRARIDWGEISSAVRRRLLRQNAMGLLRFAKGTNEPRFHLRDQQLSRRDGGERNRTLVSPPP